MIRRPPFPIRVDDLTAGFVGAALGVPVAGITTTRIGADRGMLGELYVVDLSSEDNGATPSRLIAKFAALREGVLASALRGGTHERELRCYAELLGETPVSVPEFHGAWYDPDTAHFLLLQSFVSVDENVDQIAGLTQDQARAVLAEMARLHAHWWEHDRLQHASWLPRLDAATRVENLTFLATHGWPLLAELLGDELTPSDHAIGERLSERLPVAMTALAELPSTLLHGDLRADNLLFSPDDGRVTIVDWQGTGLGPPIFDLAYFLVQSLTIDDRRSHEHELIDYYRASLAESGLSLTTDEILAGLGDALAFGLAVACAIPIISDPAEPRVRELAMAVGRRSLAALRDDDDG